MNARYAALEQSIIMAILLAGAVWAVQEWRMTVLHDRLVADHQTQLNALAKKHSDTVAVSAVSAQIISSGRDSTSTPKSSGAPSETVVLTTTGLRQ
jgi:hypothetical protein